MTYLGTRPPLISETNLYELHHRARLAIKPGITGMWQVKMTEYIIMRYRTCKMDDSNNLTKVDETRNIVKTENGAEADGVIINIDSLVSMNEV